MQANDLTQEEHDVVLRIAAEGYLDEVEGVFAWTGGPNGGPLVSVPTRDATGFDAWRTDSRRRDNLPPWIVTSTDHSDFLAQLLEVSSLMSWAVAEGKTGALRRAYKSARGSEPAE